jgi:hypothetical protein
MRALNHLTRHHEALREPSDADQLIRDVSLAVSRLPQLLEQVSGWLVAEQAAGRIGIVPGIRLPNAVLALDVARQELEKAQALARMLQQALDAVAAVTTDMTGIEDGSDEEGGE